jgi:hypothetical protein
MTYYGDINHVPASTTGNTSLNKVPETFTGYEHEGVSSFDLKVACV